MAEYVWILGTGPRAGCVGLSGPGSSLIRDIVFTSELVLRIWRVQFCNEFCALGVGQWLEMSDYLLFYDKIVQNWIIFAVIDHQMPPNASPNGSQLRVHKNLYFMEFRKLFRKRRAQYLVRFAQSSWTFCQLSESPVTFFIKGFARLQYSAILPPEVLSLM